MENSKRAFKSGTTGDAAVEGLLDGIFAGLAMAVSIVLVELVAGVSPLTVLGYFDMSSNIVRSGASPFIGLFTHVAVAGVYGVGFGVLALHLTRTLGARMNSGTWALLGVLYGMLVLGIAEWIILPRTSSALRELPLWALASAHLLYGLVLAWLTRRNK